MPGTANYDTIKLLARAKFCYSAGRVEEAVALLGEVLALCEQDQELKRLYPYRAAHADLYKIHRAQGNVPKAWEHLTQALKLGATEDELSTDDSPP